jgi:hypothetical protein
MSKKNVFSSALGAVMLAGALLGTSAIAAPANGNQPTSTAAGPSTQHTRTVHKRVRKHTAKRAHKSATDQSTTPKS